jgi:autotransporter-associated beta strand protein
VTDGTVTLGAGARADSVPLWSVQTGATLIVNGGATWNTSTSLDLAGGTVTFEGLAGGAVSHTLGTVTLKANTTSTLEIAPTEASPAAIQVMAANLVREAGATVSFQGSNADLGAGLADLRFLAVDASAADVGGILPYATVRGPAGVDLATDVDSGSSAYVVGRLTSYSDDVNDVGANVRLTGAAGEVATLAGAGQINALLIADGVTLDLAGYGLTISSGQVLSTEGENRVMGADGSAIQFGTAEALMFVEDGSLRIDVPMAGSGDLDKLRSGKLILGGDNHEFSGAIRVDEGVLTATHNDALGAIDAGTTVAAGAALEFDASAGDIYGTARSEVQTIVYRTNEQQRIRFRSLATTGTWAISFDVDGSGPRATATTDALPFNATAAMVQTALQSLSSIGVGNVAVSGTYNTFFQVVFTGALAGLNLPALSVDTESLMPVTFVDTPIEMVEGGHSFLPPNEVQILSLGISQPTSGYFTLECRDMITASIPWSSNATTLINSVRAALENLPVVGTGNVSVTGPSTPGAFVITFQGALAGMDIPPIKANTGTLSPGGIVGTVRTSTPGGFSSPWAHYNEVQAWWWNAAPNAGSYTLTFNGETTPLLAWDATANDVQSALTGLSTIGSGGVQVVGNQNDGFLVTFTGANSGVNIAAPNTAAGLIVSGPSGRSPVYSTLRDATVTMGGTYAVNLRGAGTGGIPWNATAQQVQNALESLSTIGSQVNEVQQFLFTSSLPTSGVYTLSYDPDRTGGLLPQTTVGLPYYATAAMLEAALSALPSLGPGSVAVTGAYDQGGFAITFQGNAGAVNIADGALSCDATRLTPGTTAVVATATQGGYGAYNETQAIPPVTLQEGSWQIWFKGTSVAVNWSATAAQVQTALQSLATIGTGNALVVGDYLCGYQVTFPSQYSQPNTVHGSDQPALSFDMGNGLREAWQLRDATAPYNVSVSGDYVNGYAVTFGGPLAGVDQVSFTLSSNAITPNSPTALVVPNFVETIRGASETITISGSGVDGTGAIRAVAGRTELQSAIRLNAVSPASFPATYNNPHLPPTLVSTTLAAQTIGTDAGATLVLNGRISQTLRPGSLAKAGEGTLEVGGNTVNYNGVENRTTPLLAFTDSATRDQAFAEAATLVDTAYEQYTFLNSGTLRMNKLVANGAFNNNWLYVGDNEGGRESDRLLYADNALSNQFGSSIMVWRSGQVNFNGRGDDISTLQMYDSRVYGGTNPLGGSVSGTLTMYGGIVDLESNNLVVWGVNYNSGKQAVINASGTGRLDVTTGARTFNIADGPQLYDMVINASIQGSAGGQINKASGTGALLLNAENYLTGTNEVHTVVMPGTVESFTITYNGVTTAPVAVGPTFNTGNLQSALESLLPIGQGNVAVTGGANEVQSFQYSATGGGFRLGFQGYTTAQIPWNANAAQVQAALAALPTIASTANIAVTGNMTSGFALTFQGALASTDVGLVSANYSSLLGPELPANEIQLLAIGPNEPAEGTFTLSFDPDGEGPLPSQTTAPIEWNTNAASLQEAVQAALESLVGIGNVAVTGPTTATGLFLITFQGEYAGRDMPDTALSADLSALLPADQMWSVTVATQGGAAAYNETQAYWWDAAPTTSSYTLSYGGANTPSISWIAGANVVQSALEALPTIGAGNVRVVGSTATGYMVLFGARLSGFNLPTAGVAPGLVVNGPSGFPAAYGNFAEGHWGAAAPVERTPGSLLLATNEVQQLQFGGTYPTGGTYTLSFRGVATSNLSYNSSAATVQSALERLPTLGTGNVSVTGSYRGGFVITYQGAFSGQDVEDSDLQVNLGTLQPASTLSWSVSTATTPGSMGYNETQAVYFNNTPTGGSWNLAFNGFTTGPIPWSATAAEVQAALETLSTIGAGNVAVVGDAGNGYQLTFQGRLHGTDLPQITAASAGLTPSTGFTINTWRAGGGLTPSIYFINVLGGADMGLESYTLLSGSGTIAGGTLTGGVWAVQLSAGTLALGNDNALGNGAVNASGGTIWAAHTDRTINGLVSLSNTVALGGRREWGDAHNLSLPTAQLAGNATLNVDDQNTEVRIGYVNEVQTINLLSSMATAGSWTLTFNGYQTASLPWNASAIMIEQALNALPSIGNYGGGSGSVGITNPISSMPYLFSVTFQGSAGARDVPYLLVANVVDDPTGTAPAPIVTELIPGAALGGTITENAAGRNLAKGGIGRLTLAGDNSYTGHTTITGGIVRVMNSHPFGLGGPGTIVDVAGISAGGQPAAIEIDGSLTPTGGIAIVDKTIELRVPSVLGIATGYLQNYGGMIRNLAGDNTITGRIDLRSSSTSTQWVFLGSDVGSLNVAAEIAGIDSGGTSFLPGMHLAKTGAGKLIFSGSGGNTYSGNTLLIDGTLALETGALGINGTGTPTIYVGDHTTGSGRDVLEIGAPEQVIDTANVVLGKTGKIQTVDAMAAQTSDTRLSISLAGGVSSGTWVLVFDPDGTGPAEPEYTAGLPWNANAARLAAALNALPSIGGAGGFVEVAGTLTRTSESQALLFNNGLPTDGTYSLTFDPDGSGPIPAHTTSAFNYNDTAGTLESKLQALPTIGDNGVSVTGAYTTGFVITFGGKLAGQDVLDTALSFNPGTTGVEGTVASIGQGAALAYNTTQSLSFTPPTGGTWTVSFNSATSSVLNWNATAGEVQNALEGMSSIGPGNVIVSGSYDGGYLITFVGAFQGLNVPAVTANVANLLPGGRTATISVLRSGGIDPALTLDTYYVIFRGALAGREIDAAPAEPGSQPYLSAMTLLLAGETPSVEFRTLTAGGEPSTPANNETQYVAGLSAGAQFTLRFRGDSTPTFNNNTTTAAQLEAALNSLPSIAGAGGYVRVGGGPNAVGGSAGYFITFLGGLAGQDLPNLVASVGTVTETSRGGLGAIESLNGSFTATLGDVSSTDVEIAAGTTLALNSNLTYNVFPGIVSAVPARISGQGELSLISALNTTGGTRTITVNDGPADDDLIITAALSEGPAGMMVNVQKDGAGVSRMVLAPSSGANTYTGITTVNSGFLNIRTDNALGPVSTNEVQRVTFSTFATGGTWTLTFRDQTTVPLAWDATCAEVAAAINALPAVGDWGGYVRVVNYSSARDFALTFLGGLAGTNWADNLLSADASGLLPSITASVTTQIQGGTRSPTVVNSGYTLELEGGVTVTDEPLTLTGTGRLLGSLSYVGQTVAGTGALRAVSGSNVWQGSTAANLITPSGDPTYRADEGARLVLAASINASTRALYKTGPGEVEIRSPAGVNTTYTGTGATYVNEGVLVLNKPARLADESQVLTHLGLADEQQRVTFSVTNPTSGSWSLSFEGQTTAMLAYNASATNVRDALAALAAVGGTVNVDVQGSMAAGFTVTFVNGCGDRHYELLTVDTNTLNLGTTIAVVETVGGGAPVTGGTYSLIFNGQTTWPLAWNATPAAVQMALETLPTVGAGNVVVGGTPGGELRVTFRNFLGNADLPLMTAQIYMAPGTPAASVVSTEVNKGVGDEIQTLSFSAHPAGGYFVLNYNGSLTVPLPFTADASQVQAALEAIPALGVGNVQVVGGPGTPISPFVVRFVNQLAGADVNALVGIAAMSPATTISVAETAKGGYSTLGQTLGSGSVFIGSAGAAAAIRYGAESSSNAIPDTAAVYVLPSGLLDLATQNQSERIATLWLGVGGTRSAQVATGTGTLALNPAGDTTGYFTLTDVDGGTNWGPATISGNLDLASPQMPRTRRWFKVADSPAAVELDVNANIVGQGGLEKAGRGTLILSGANTYTGETIVNEGLVLVASGTAFGSPADGTTVEWGGAIGFTGGVDYAGAESLTLASTGSTSLVAGVEVPTPALFNAAGSNAYAGPITVNYPCTLVSTIAGETLTLSGPLTLNAELVIDGAGDTLLAGAIASGSEAWQAGLLEGRFTGGTTGVTALFDESAPNTGTGGVRLRPDAGETASLPPWADYTGYIYTGQFYDADGVFTFAENIDDMVEVKIDGITRLRNAGGNTPSTTGSTGLNSENPFGAASADVTYGMGPHGDGWHDIEIRFFNLTGAAGAQGTSLWNSLKGFGFDPGAINSNAFGNAYAIPADPGDMSLFRTRVANGNALTKTGSGTLTLTGQNTYSGPTTLREGVLRVDGSTGTGTVTVQSGTTLSGVGGTLAGALTVEPGGLFDPGPDDTTLTVTAELTLATGSTFRVDLNGVAAGLEYDQIVAYGAIHLNQATLEPDLGYAPSPTDRFVVIDNRGPDPIDGEFAGLPNHSIVNLGGQDFRVVYDGGDGNDMVLVRIAPLAVASVRYDAGPDDLGAGRQRSTVSRIVITFNGLVDALDPERALRVDRVLSLGDSQPVDVDYSERQMAEATQLILTFTGDDIYTYQRPAGSDQYGLNDGNYRLTIDHTLLHSQAGDMAVDRADDFYRWFGDVDGDRYVSGADLFAIRRIMVNDPSSEKYRAGFDYDGDERVTNIDYNQFRVRYGRRLLPPA